MDSENNVPVLPVLTVNSGTPEEVVCPDEGIYILELTGISDVKMRGFGNTDPNKLECKAHFKIHGTKWDGTTIKQFMSLSAHTSSFMYELVVALNGGERLPDGTPLNIADFIGKRCKGLVSVTEKPSSKDPGKTVRYPKIEKARPIPPNEATF
jgi:hypothetical protein